LSDPRGVRTVGCRGPWDETIEPDWFAKPTSPRTSGFSCYKLSLHCSRACAAETRSAHPRSRITIRGLSRPTPSTRRGRILEGSPGRHAVCRQAAAEPASTASLLLCACFYRTHAHSSLLFVLYCRNRAHLSLAVPQLHPCTPVLHACHSCSSAQEVAGR
jgi:hypothetical protein